jgi:hypothetical protein
MSMLDQIWNNNTAAILARIIVNEASAKAERQEAQRRRNATRTRGEDQKTAIAEKENTCQTT